MAFQGERDSLVAWAEKKTAEGIATYQQANNTTSLDGLPGLQPGPAVDGVAEKAAADT